MTRRLACLAQHAEFRMGRCDLDIRSRRGRLSRRAGAVCRGRLRAQIAVAGLVRCCGRFGSGCISPAVPHGITDDPRYAKLLQEWGAGAAWQMFLLLQKQALVSIPLALSIILAARNPAASVRLQDVIAMLVLIVAITGEGIADAQLRAFRADPANRGRVCDAGLWGWSRHPNYFFEWLGWIAYPLFAIDLAARIRGAGLRLPARSACTGCCCMSPAFRRSKRTCWNAGRRRFAPINHAPMRSSRPRHGSPEGARHEHRANHDRRRRAGAVA